MIKLNSLLLSCLAALALSALPARAAIIVLQPSDQDLADLDHYTATKWNINRQDLVGQTITGVSLFFDNIRNWAVEPNTLYLQLMNSYTYTGSGLQTYYDNQASGNYFGSTGINIHTYSNLGTTAQDLTYNFSASEIATLTGYLVDGKFSLGFDPDCHYFNDGIKLTITTASVPEPGTMALMGMGLLATGFIYRRKRA